MEILPREPGITRREGTKLIKEFPVDEKVIGITQFQGKVIVATERAIYRMNEAEQLEKIEIQYAEAK